MKKNFFIQVFCTSIVLLFLSCQSESIKKRSKLDLMISKSRDANLLIEDKKKYLDSAQYIVSTYSNDSTKINNLQKIAYNYLLLGDFDLFGHFNKEALAITKKDTYFMSGSLYESLAYFYIHKFKNDSAFYYYFNALSAFQKNNNELGVARSYQGMAILQNRTNDLVRAENNSIKALQIYKKHNDLVSIYSSYNSLAITNKRLHNIEKSFEYHQKANSLIDNNSSLASYKSTTLNNLGTVYLDQKNYDNAIEYFSKGIEYELTRKEKDMGLFAILIENLAYANFKNGNNKTVEKNFLKSLHIRDSLGDSEGITTAAIHLSEYYWSIKDKKKALNYVNKALDIAKKNNYHSEVLKSYKFLAKIDSLKERDYYLNKYITLNDSLLLNERKIQEKFTRIVYKVNDLIKEKEQEKEKKWNWIYISIFGALFSFVSILLIVNRSKKNKLKFQLEKEQSNKKVFELMLSSRAKFQEGSDYQRKEISLNLHDNILSRMFGVRLNLESLIEDDIANEFVNELQKIEEDVRNISHNLNSNFYHQNDDLFETVKEILKSSEKIGNYASSIKINSELKGLEIIPTDTKIQIIYILKELITNIVKHAQANKVKLNITVTNELFNFVLSDDGKGFQLSKKGKGIGLKNIFERVKGVDGTIKINSKLEKGTRINCNIPLHN